MKIDLPEIYTTPFESQKLDEQHFAAQYENPTAMLACWLECRSTIKDMIMNQLSDNEVLQSLENVRAIWPQSTILQKETANLRVIFSDPLNTPEEQKKIRAEIVIYLCNLFLEYIDSEQADLPYDLALADLQKITDQCLKLLISPVGTYFEHPPEEDEAHEQPKEQTDPLTELAKIVRSTIKNRLMN